MRVATYTRHSLQSEIEELCLVACFLKEWNKEGAKAAVYMQECFTPQSEFGERRDVVDYAVRKVWCGANKQNSVAVDET